MTVQVIKGKYPHVGWVDIEGKGILTEIAIMSNGPTGLMFIKLNALDAIDKQRLFRVIMNRNAALHELWDLMSNITLGNGANALEYFHQYVKVLTSSGEVMNPQMGRIADPRYTGVRTIQPQNAQQVIQETVQQAAQPEPTVPPAKKTTTRRKTTTKEGE